MRGSSVRPQVGTLARFSSLSFFSSHSHKRTCCFRQHVCMCVCARGVVGSAARAWIARPLRDPPGRLLFQAPKRHVPGGRCHVRTGFSGRTRLQESRGAGMLLAPRIFYYCSVFHLFSQCALRFPRALEVCRIYPKTWIWGRFP